MAELPPIVLNTSRRRARRRPAVVDTLGRPVTPSMALWCVVVIQALTLGVTITGWAGALQLLEQAATVQPQPTGRGRLVPFRSQPFRPGLGRGDV